MFQAASDPMPRQGRIKSSYNMSLGNSTANHDMSSGSLSKKARIAAGIPSDAQNPTSSGDSYLLSHLLSRKQQHYNQGVLDDYSHSTIPVLLSQLVSHLKEAHSQKGETPVIMHTRSAISFTSMDKEGLITGEVGIPH